MVIGKLRAQLRAELETPVALRRFGSGWLSGVGGLIGAVAGLFFVCCLSYPALFTMPEIRPVYSSSWFRLALHILLILSFVLSALSLALRDSKMLGGLGMAITLLATILGGSRVETNNELTSGVFLGLDWFVLNVIFTGFLFVPLERLAPKYREQRLFRTEWREDLFYYLVSSLFVQSLTFMSLKPAMTLTAHTNWQELRTAVSSQPLWLQFIEIMFLTDLVQYWVHRAFHRIPFLWGFHAVHHSARSMDWMAGARMHVLEIVCLRSLTVVPMYILGFTEIALHSYILAVYLHSTFIHANIGWNLEWLGKYFVTPRFHHWHHGLDKEAIDVNFAIHFPLFDRLFGTYYLPPKQWPNGYGISGHPVPLGYWKQFCHPFRKRNT